MTVTARSTFPWKECPVKRVLWNLACTAFVLAGAAVIPAGVAAEARPQDNEAERNAPRAPDKEAPREFLKINENELKKPGDGQVHHLLYVASASKQGCSTFDLGPQGRMHLHWGSHYEVYPLLPRGSSGGFRVYQEDSPYRWLWAFSERPGRGGYLIYYKPSEATEWYLLDNKGSLFPRLP
jgi:hypothetical protein